MPEDGQCSERDLPQWNEFYKPYSCDLNMSKLLPCFKSHVTSGENSLLYNKIKY
jgi:hypothetical protein